MTKSPQLCQKMPMLVKNDLIMTNSRHDYEITCDRDFILSMPYVSFDITALVHMLPHQKNKKPPIPLWKLDFWPFAKIN